MATKKPKAALTPIDPTIMEGASQDVQDYLKKRQIDETMSRRAAEEATRRKNEERKQAENRAERDRYQGGLRARTYNVSGKTLKFWKKNGRPLPRKPEYKPIQNGDRFGENAGPEKNEPWRPVDTYRPGKDGNPKRIHPADITGSRYTAEFESKDYKATWIKNWMEEHGFPQDGSTQSEKYNNAMGGRQAMEQAQAEFRKHFREMQGKKQDAVREMWNAQQKPAAPATVPAQPVETAAGAAVAAQQQRGEVAASQPLVTPGSQPAPVAAQPAAPAAPAAPVKPTAVAQQAPKQDPEEPVTVKSGDGQSSVTVPAQYAAGARQIMGEYDARNGGRAPRGNEGRILQGGLGPTSGRGVGGNRYFFGDDSAYSSYMKKKGVLV